MGYRDHIENGEPLEIIRLSDSRRIEVALKHIYCKTYLDMREYVRFRGTTEYRPTKRGLCVELSIIRNYLSPAIIRCSGQDIRLIDASSSTDDKPQ